LQRLRTILILIVGLALTIAWGANEALTGGCDYYTYIIAAIALSHGQNIYLASASDYAHIAMQYSIPCWAYPYLYSPLPAIIAWPLTLIPPRLGAAVWIIGSGLAAIASGLLLGNRADRPWKSDLILLATIGFTPVFSAMHLGQPEAYPLLFTALALYEWRLNRDFLGGALLALGIWFKPMAAGLLLLIFWRSKWQALAGAASASLLTVVAGVAAFGLGPTLTQLNSFVPFFRFASSIMPVPDFRQNLLGIIVSMLATQSRIIPLAYSAVAALFVLAILLVMWPPSRKARGETVEAGLLIVTTTLLFPATEFHHLIMLLLCFAPLIMKWHPPNKRSWKNWAALTGAYALILGQGVYDLNLFGLSKYSTNFPTAFFVLFSSVWAQLTLWILLLMELKKAGRFARTQIAPTPAVAVYEERLKPTHHPGARIADCSRDSILTPNCG
jgi:hypothetical protein